MSITEKAGNSLPQDCAALEQFVKAQAHIRAAVTLIDNISILPLPHLPERRRASFKNLAEAIRATLWEADCDVQDLVSAYCIPLFPIDNPIKE